MRRCAAMGPSQLDGGSAPRFAAIKHGGLRAVYRGAGNHAFDAATLRTDRPMPATAAFFYFEVVVEHARPVCTVAVGFSSPAAPANQQLGGGTEWVAAPAPFSAQGPIADQRPPPAAPPAYAQLRRLLRGIGQRLAGRPRGPGIPRRVLRRGRCRRRSARRPPGPSPLRQKRPCPRCVHFPARCSAESARCPTRLAVTDPSPQAPCRCSRCRAPCTRQ